MNKLRLFHRIAKSFRFPLLALLMLGCEEPEAGKEEDVAAVTFEGEAVIPNIGTVTFPAGEWELEFENFTASEKRVRRFVVFKKVGEIPERLTFLVYPYSKHLRSYFDIVWEDLGDGIPREVTEHQREGVAHPMRTSDEIDEGDSEDQVEFSFILVGQPSNPNWICHSVIQGHEDSGLLVIIGHSSTKVLDPDIVYDVAWDSQFTKDKRK